ncbi:hypothetical protein GA0061100_10524 [Rhizobium hainanense]|uniref:Uncharacterized protein n=1 Tax=Rhizobium hainanense TaxID=52131 RepID=A0A1C3V9E8_9HYPH|nr:hypothetical protein [Rhizobium hainanense]SCB24247.1 hypothetical protein GA0061100_10524 [Rhizobium hainanense]
MFDQTPDPALAAETCCNLDCELRRYLEREGEDAAFNKEARDATFPSQPVYKPS